MDNDEYTIDISSLSIDTITLTAPVNPSIGDITWDTTSNTYNVYTDSSDWISISDSSIDLNNITIVKPVEFEDCMPDVAKIEDMCNDYPALEKAYENFKTVYKMVEQDWRGKQNAKNGSLF